MNVRLQNEHNRRERNRELVKHHKNVQTQNFVVTLNLYL